VKRCAEQIFANAAERRMPERVDSRSRAEEISCGVLQAFRGNDNAMRVIHERFANARDKCLRVERHFGQKHDMRRVFGRAFALSERRSRGNPSGAASHDFDDRDEVVAPERSAVESELANGRRDVFNRAPVAGAMVGNGQIVVDCFRHADHANFVALRGAVVRDFF